jgi:BlaI family transcriptional regulator, penicillinase repressor
MLRTGPDVTDAELAILQVLWERGTCTRRQLAEALYPADASSQYTTVQKLLERLETKGFVDQERVQGTLRFRPAVERDELISQRLVALAERLCDGSMTPLLMNLVRAQPLKPHEVDALRSYLDELKRSAKPRCPRR